MENLKFVPNMTLLASFVLLLVSCNNDITEITPTENKEFSVINGVNVKTEIFSEFQKVKMQDPIAKNYALLGDTVIIYQEPITNKISGSAPDLKNLKSVNDGKPLRMVSIGSNLTAGFRDGGYFNEGILTSYPNLVAKQMQLPQFNQPLFDDNSFNGFGRKAPTRNNPTGGPVQKYNIVKNNLGIENITANEIKLKKYKGSELDNYAIPFLSRNIIGETYGITLAGYYKNSIEPTNILKRESLFRIFNTTESYDAKVFSKATDFVILELRGNEILNNILGGNEIIGQIVEEKYIFEEKPYQQINLGLTPELSLMRDMEVRGIKKGVLLNLPNFINLPYFNSITEEMVRLVGLDKPLSITISQDGSSGQVGYFDINSGRLLPTFAVDSLLSNKVSSILKRGTNNNRPLKIFTDVISKTAFTQTINNHNNEINLLSKRFGYPVVDIKMLYDKVINGSYITDDGLKITSKEFFSTDGIYPSALGQACIANEVIKIINNTYKTAIPLANIKEFVKK